MHFEPKANARFGLRWTFAGSGLLAVLAAVISVYKIGLLPPQLQPRALEIGTASTTVLVDMPKSTITDLAANSESFGSLQARAALLGNLMATDPVKVHIARLAGLAPGQIDAAAPITANVPQTLIEPGSGAAASDILATADHYQLQIQADPAVPILHIYVQAPSAAAAVRLAGASVAGLHEYLDQLAAHQKLKPGAQIRLQALGVPHGGVVNSGAAIQIALLTLVTVFAIAFCALMAASRLRMGLTSANHGATAAR
jgi:hypothetical protein